MKNEELLSTGSSASKEKAVPVSEVSTLFIARFAVLVSVAIIAPLFNVQFFTGTIVNAGLFVAVALIGARGAILIGTLPSVVVASFGLLSPAIFPMVPFIIFSNALLVLTFSFFKNKSYWKGVAAAAALKFSFLSFAGSFVIGLFVPEKIASQLALAMGYPQLLTALSGGVLAYFVLGIMRKPDRRQ